MDSQTSIRDILARQAAVSKLHFGPDQRTVGLQNHIMQEIGEINSCPTPKARSKEWVDIVILGLDGLLRSVRNSGPEHYDNTEVASIATHLLLEKLHKNELREFADWRTTPADAPINHTKEAPE